MSWGRQRKPEGDGGGSKEIHLSHLRSSPPRNSRVPWKWRPPKPPLQPTSVKKTSKRDKQTDHLPLAWPANFDCRPSPMPCAKMDAPLREDSAAGGGGVKPIAVRLRRRPPRPDAGGELGFEAKDAGSMVARLRQEG